MIELHVAWGMTNYENAIIDDPKAEKNLKQFYGDPMYKVYSFETRAEIDAFKLAVKEMEYSLTGYIVEKET